MKLTALQRELLLDRLALPECIAECIAQTRVIAGLTQAQIEAMPDYDARCAEIGERIGRKVDHLDSCVRAGFISSELINDRDYVDILEDACDGSTFFANEDDSIESARFGGEYGKPRSWWARRHAAADDLEVKLSELLGRKITFARY